MRRWVMVAALAAAGCDDGGGAERSDAAPSDGAVVDAAVDRGTVDAAPMDAATDATPLQDEGVARDAGPDADPDAAPPAAEAARLEAGDVALVAFEDGAFDLRWAGETRLRFGPDALRLGLVDAVADDFNYDPWNLFTGPVTSHPRGLDWQTPTAAAVERSADTLTLTLTYPAGDATLTLRLEGERIVARLQPPAGEVAYFRLVPTVDADEDFYGLGSALDRPNHRGKRLALQLEIDLFVESANNEANVPVPLLIGTRGWGLFVEDDHPMAVDVAATDPTRVDFQVGTGPASSDGLRFHLFAAAHPLDVLKPYFEVTGFPKLPATWALGPWLWRDENRDQAEVESDVQTMRDLDLAATGVWVDRPYASGVSSFDFHPTQFPDPAAMIQRAHDLGFRFALWHTAYVGEDQAATAALHEEAEAGGYYPPQTGPIVNNWGRPVDYTNPDAYAWWQDLVRRYTDLGVEGFKLDYVQDVVAGLGPRRNVWIFADGSTERTMHKRYQALYHQVFAETLPQEGPSAGGFLLTRTGVYGDQTNGVIIWPGDLDATMARHKDRVQDRDGSSYSATGGLPASMVDGLSLAASGFAFYGSDTGGYRHCPPDKETFTRWFQQTALSSVMQIGTSCNDVAWEFEDANGFDAEMLDWYRTYTRLHLRLWPYAWTLANAMLTDGRPLQRPYGLQHPELGKHPWDTYFFGDDLLVAPVMERDARTRTVPFPPGDWFDWWTGARVEGGADREMDAPLGTLPLYLRAGGIVPMLRPTIDTLAPVADPDAVDSFATEAGRLYVRLAAGPANALTLYDGTRIAHDGAAVSITPGDVFTTGAQLEIVGLDAPTVEGVPALPDRAALEAADRGWWWDPAGTLYVRLGPADRAIDLR
ncbi:MAG: glycoside hydrolase family 31 protein [Myxococcales bacterium]|nr:glycoside hydrolase family 31 protein [Myxococcales bacterium]